MDNNVSPTMKIIIHLIVVIIGISLCSCSSGSPPGIQTSENPPPPRPVPAGYHALIDSILGDSLLSPCFVGVKIVSLDDGKVLYEQNGNKLFHPASNMKILTSATGLKTLGKDFKFETKVTSVKPARKGILGGDLYIKGSGDPLIRTEDVDSIAATISNSGIRRIKGDIVGDVSYFDSVAWGSGWMWDDEPEADEAFISPLTINDNAISVMVQPGTATGKPVHVELNPSTKYMRVINSGVTSLDTLVPPLSVTRHRGENTILVQGRISPHSPGQEFSLSMVQPELYFLTLLKESLTGHGITVDGTTRLDSARGTITLATLSHSLDSTLHQINKPSDNIAAENLLKTVAAERRGSPGATLNGLYVMKEFMTSLGIDTTAMILADGSGVSFYNLVSPGTILRLLQYEYADKQSFSHFYESLPVGGVDGTLKNRMKGTRAEGNVHEKTGTITGVSALSGYVTTLDGKSVAFSILINHFPSKLRELRDVQDRIVEILANTRLGPDR